MIEETNEKPIYERLEGESPKEYAKFLYYRGLNGARRSLLASYVSYINSTKKTPQIEVQRDNIQRNTEKSRKLTSPSKSWEDLAVKWNWRNRAEAYDAKIQADKEIRQSILDEIEAEEERLILSTGYALKHRRIQELTNTIDLIKKSFRDGKTDEVNYAWVSADKIRELRGALDDIAKELGERVQRKELSGKNGGPIEVRDIVTEWGGGALDGDSAEGNV